MKEEEVFCINCNQEVKRENIYQFTNLISYVCPNCGANVFDKVEEDYQ